MTSRPSLVGIAILGATFGCNSDSEKTPFTRPVITVAAVRITGNTRLMSIGETSPLTAVLEMSDGSTRPAMPNNISWNVTSMSVATISSEGVLTAVAGGETVVAVTHKDSFRRAVTPVFVLPDGPFILQGTVTEPGFPLGQVTVEVVSGAGAGRQAQTSFNGRYALYGFSGPLLVRAAKPGYATETKNMDLERDDTLDFSLLPSPAHVQLAPRYAFRLVASESCAGQLPEEVRSRTYTAIVHQNSAAVEIELQGGLFAETADKRYNRFSGRARGNRVEFVVGDYYDPQIIELIDETHFFIFSGLVTATVDPMGFSALMSGALHVGEGSEGPFGRAAGVGFCSGQDHQFIFSRP